MFNRFSLNYFFIKSNDGNMKKLVKLLKCYFENIYFMIDNILTLP